MALAPLLIVVIAFVAALIDHRTRIWALGLVLALGFAITGIWMLFMWDKYIHHIPVLANGQNARMPTYTQAPATFSTTTVPAKAESSSKQKAPDTAAADNSSTVSKPSEPSTSQSTSSTRPDWADQPPSKQGDAYIVPVESGIYSDPIVREQMLEAKMVAAANSYIDDVLYHRPGIADVVAIDADYLRNNNLRSRTLTPGNSEMFVKLEFDNRFRDEVDRRYREFIAQGRLEKLGEIVLAVAAGLGGLYSYLKLTQPKPAAAAPAGSPA